MFHLKHFCAANAELCMPKMQQFTEPIHVHAGPLGYVVLHLFSKKGHGSFSGLQSRTENIDPENFV